MLSKALKNASTKSTSNNLNKNMDNNNNQPTTTTTSELLLNKKPSLLKTKSAASSTTTTTATSKPFVTPDVFGIVETSLYRCSLPNSNHFSFLETLHLKTILFLSQELIEKSLSKFCEKNNIELINLGISLVQYPQSCQSIYQSKQTNDDQQDLQQQQQVLADISTSTWKHCSEELVKEALELVLDKDNYPILIACSSGIHTTGTVIGCLRRMQSWSLTSILDEYETYAGNNSRYINRQFIELFDVDLISMNQTQLPPWFIPQQDLMLQERNYLMNHSTVATKSSQVPKFTKDDRRMAFYEYWFCRDAPLISGKSSFSKHSVIEEEDD